MSHEVVYITPTAQCHAYAANRISQAKPKYAARACHFQNATVSNKVKKKEKSVSFCKNLNANTHTNTNKNALTVDSETQNNDIFVT